MLCIDVGPEMTSEWLGGGSGGAATSRMLVAKAALRGFVGRKASFNPKVSDRLLLLFMLLLVFLLLLLLLLTLFA